MRGKFRFRKRSKNLGKFKSKLEQKFAQMMQLKGLKFEYEPDRISYVRRSHYVPDWRIRKDVYIETKGYLSPSNRANILSFREQHPHVRVYFLFGCAKNKLNPKSETTYGDWCDRHGFKWADIRQGVPTEWWTE